VYTSPAASTATQNVGDTHDTAFSAAPVPTRIGFDHMAPSKVRALPPLSAARQNVGPVQDMAVTMLSVEVPAGWSTSRGALHDDPFHVTTLPSLSPATQKVGAGHDTDRSWPVSSWLPGWDHIDPFQRAIPPPSVAMQNVGVTHDNALAPPHAPEVPDQRAPS
jgi:hypothetical protein